MPKGVQVIWTPWKHRSELVEVREWLYGRRTAFTRDFGLSWGEGENEVGEKGVEIEDGEDLRRLGCDLVGFFGSCISDFSFGRRVKNLFNGLLTRLEYLGGRRGNIEKGIENF